VDRVASIFRVEEITRARERSDCNKHTD
jgi:hypothetical protein